jgi:hypothetical protein
MFTSTMPRELIAITATIRGTVWRAALGHTLLSPRQVDCRMNDVALWLDSRALRSLHRLQRCMTLARLKATSQHSDKFVERTRWVVTRAASSLGMAMGVSQALAKPRERRLFFDESGSTCLSSRARATDLCAPLRRSKCEKRNYVVRAFKLCTLRAFGISRFRAQHTSCRRVSVDCAAGRRGALTVLWRKLRRERPGKR